jgi:hypothetical protein
MTPTLDDLRAALNTVAKARGPLVKRDAMRALVEISSAFADKVRRMAAWLDREWTWLEANTTDADFEKREREWIDRVRRYEEAHDELGKALQAIAGKEHTR